MGRHVVAMGLILFAAGTGLAAQACGAASEGPPPITDGGPDGGTQCQSDRDCGTGLVCRTGRCESPADAGIPDAGPPEDEKSQFQPPVPGRNYVFVVNTTRGTVAKIDPGRLETIQVSSIQVGVKPTVLYAIPGTDNAVVLNEGSRSLSLIQASPGGDQVTEVGIGQPYTSLAMSPDGAFAIAYFDQRNTVADPDNSASKVTVVDLASVIQGLPKVYEYAVGYRVTNVVFDSLPGPNGPWSTRALVVSKSEIAVLDLAALDSVLILPRVRIENPDAEVVEAREVVCTPDLRFLLFRTYQNAELTVVDMASRSSARLMLHGVPSDLDISGDGSRGVIVERAAGVVARLDLPADLSRTVDVNGVRYYDPNGDGVASPDDLVHVQALEPDGQPLVVGQAELFVDSNGLLAAVLYSNVERREEISLLDIASMAISVPDHLINKLVDFVAIAPGGRTALVVHRPEPDSPETDPVEKRIDSLNGYTLVDLATLATFQQVTAAGIGPLAFSSGGGHVLLTLYDQGLGVNQLHVLDLARLTLQMDSVPLDAKPTFAGVLPGDEIGFVAQEHPYGKITFVDMNTMAKRAVTGFELNAD